jgi:hypothetical protein
MTPALAVTAIRSQTAHDADQQVTDVQLTAEIDREYRRTRRWLSNFLPGLYRKVALFTLAFPQKTITKPDDFERLTLLEQQFSQGYWDPLTMRPALHASEGIARDCTGSYRLTYVTRPVDGYTVLDVPEGAEDIIIANVSGWLRQRHNEDPTYHLQRAQALKDEIRVGLAFRNGAHPQSIMQSQYGNAPVGSFYEEGATFVIV